MSGKEKLIGRLGQIVGAERVLTDPAHLEQVCWDALSPHRLHPLRRPEPAPPMCAVLPVSTSEVCKIILLANEEKVPIVPYGGGSGLMGGALSLQSGIVVDLRRMNGVLEISAEAYLARVQSGVVLESLEKKLNDSNLILGHDPWTLPVATVGGAISTNSLGYRGAKYGSMGEQVLGLEVVLPNGEILRTRVVPKSSTGIGLKHLFIGAEGCFGIITEATLRVFPMPERRSLCAVGFASFEKGYPAVQKISALDLRPALLDFGDDPGKVRSGAVLYLGFEGPREVVEAEECRALAICGEEGGKRLPRAKARQFWEQRHIIGQRFALNRPLIRRRHREGILREWIHVALPTSQVLAFRRAAIEILGRRNVGLRESGLWTRPELFSMSVAVEGQDAEQAQWTLEEAVDELLRLAQAMGGSMEYCHGVGVKLAALMGEEHGYGLEVMRQIKKALDPNNIMNPGKMGL